MRGFVYNFPYIVNKKILSRIKENSGITGDSAFENHVHGTLASCAQSAGQGQII
jgi:hypothetical protein